MPDYLNPLNGLEISEALAEDAIGAGVDDVKVSAFEIWHPSMSEPTRVVVDSDAMLATLEADAPRNAGEEVNHLACSILFDVAEESGALGNGEMSFQISNINQFISEALDLARESEDPDIRDATWQLIERVYMRSDTSAPHKLPVLKITLARVTMQGGTAVFTAAWRPSSNTSIPAITFTPEYYSGLLT